LRYVRIPLERIPVLIGKNGRIKQKIEKKNIIIDINSENGDIKVSASDSLGELEAENVVKAIGRGFSPEKAFFLFNDDYYFEMLDVRDWVGKKHENIKRILGRVIGREGKSRKFIEEITSTFISIYGNTICIIGKIDELQATKRAIEMLLEGANHQSIYKFLEREKRRWKLKQYGNY
jgi:ribosomal RNA assembly protein